MELSDLIRVFKEDREIGPASVYYRYVPPIEAECEKNPPVSEGILSILPNIGISRLFTHQSAALRLIRKGANVLVSTPTSSGKSLIYNLAVLEELLKNPQARALYVFPLKALEQDQLKNLTALLDGYKGRKITASVYDGDTTAYNRKKIRSSVPEILVTNPDMLHAGILAHHEGWETLLKNLSLVVLDEVHTYRGIFGSHMNQVIRRLKRICRSYGANPRFVLLSATVSNPGQFAESLVEEKIEVVERSGAPRAGQHFLFMNPLSGPNFSAAKLFTQCIQRGFRTIAFTQARKLTELIHLWVSQLSPRLREKVSSYRAGFMPEERREIERKLARGELLGVVSTSALEMGIDIGYLDVCLLVGYPGTIITTWQRGGRVGRSGRESLVILVGKPDALDQYFMKHPEELFERSYEAALLDPHNPFVVKDHLPCAAAERPITLEDGSYWPNGLESLLHDLEREGKLVRTMEGEPTWFSTKRNPHAGVNIRSAGHTYTIFDENTGSAIGTVDGMRALTECHPGAIYLHRAKQYLIRELHLDKKDIIAKRSDLKYFTRIRTEKETEILEILRSRPKAQFLVREGRVKVTEWVTGYEKRALPGQELLGVHDLDLPPQMFETMGFWIELEDAARRLVEQKGFHFMGGIHAIEHAMIGLFPLFALCDRNDIGGISYPHHPELQKSAVFIYDGYPGGVGLAQHGFDVVQELLEKTLSLLNQCGCEDGCPSCIHSPKCGNGNKPLDKSSAKLILEFLLGHIPLSEICGETSEEEPELLSVEPIEADKAANLPRILYFDLETRRSAQEVGGWQNTHLMGISIAVLFDSIENRFLSFTEERVDELLTLLHKADLVVGFNIRRFDYGVLGAYTGKDLKAVTTFDILEDVHRRLGFRLSLDHLACETLNCRKECDGLQALKWFKAGEMAKLQEYCCHDVEMTRDLFLYGLENGHLVYRMKEPDQRVRLLVDWKVESMIKKME
ncbi:MAG: DEAD/DEAH box helicase [Deltaproteobacteria bacterium HGW-Deltaproteobacteria-15]|nr:MAG: DEAD/DEAH box helicase [Deltaproteobacteria bacterium HGW-Deltaproteobacteria-15]